MDATPQNAWLTLPAQVSQVAQAAAWLRGLGDRYRIPASKLTNLDLCLDEVLMNVLAHSGVAQTGAPIELHFQWCRDGSQSSASVTVVDAGTPFNPLDAAPKPRPNHLGEAGVGGLGLHIVRHNAQQLAYRFQDGKNQLTFGIAWVEEGSNA